MIEFFDGHHLQSLYIYALLAVLALLWAAYDVVKACIDDRKFNEEIQERIMFHKNLHTVDMPPSIAYERMKKGNKNG